MKSWFGAMRLPAQPFRRDSARAFWRLAALAMLAALPRLVFADAVCTGQSEVLQVPIQFMVTVPRDAPVGTMLTPWASSPAFTDAYSCQVTSESAAGAGVLLDSKMLKTDVQVIDPSGEMVSVWKMDESGIGVAFSTRAYACNSWFSWVGFNDRNKGNGCKGKSGTVTTSVQLRAALVKVGPIQSGTFMPGIMAQSVALTSATGSLPYTIDTTNAKSFALTGSYVRAAACTTPNVTVEMGHHFLSEFKGVGSTTKPVSFNLAVKACPAGLAKIQYRFIPVGAILDRANGVIALSGSATASGIGLQLKDANGNPLKYNTQYTLGSYSPSAGGTYQIPLTAAYYQTQRTMTPGNADAILTFTMSYL